MRTSVDRRPHGGARKGAVFLIDKGLSTIFEENIPRLISLWNELAAHAPHQYPTM